MYLYKNYDINYLLINKYMGKETKSIVEEATEDLQRIVEVAKRVAQEKLATELPDKFDKLLNEELNKISSKESVKESDKDKSKEPVKGSKSDKNKESLNEDIDMRNFSMEEVENSYNQANSMDEFDVKPDNEENKPEVTVDDIASALESMDGLQKEAYDEQANDPYTKFKELYEAMGKIVQEMTEAKMHEEYGAQFEAKMCEAFGDSYKDSLGDDKVNELYEMFVARQSGDPFDESGAVNEAPSSGLSSKEKSSIVKKAKKGENIGHGHFKDVEKKGEKEYGSKEAGEKVAAAQMWKNKAKHANESVEDKGEPFEDKSSPSAEQGQSIDEMHNQGAQTADPNKGNDTTPHGIEEKWAGNPKVKHTGENTKQSVGQLEKELGTLKKKSEVEHEKGEKTDAETKKKEHQKEFAIRAKQGFPKGKTEGEEKEGEEVNEEQVDEIHGQSYSAGKVRAGTLPHEGAEYRDRPGHSRDREQWSHQNESYKKRMESLINENKKLSKELNEMKEFSATAEELVENYKTHLNKYRSQLREMAVFNTNLANVNNLLVNEDLALTAQDKSAIIDKFKRINSIDESDKVYNTLLTEIKEGKKTLTEEVENKVSTSVGESSKKKLDEAIERTAYENDEHVKKLKYLMEYVDKRRK